jgi:hypothetical protein
MTRIHRRTVLGGVAAMMLLGAAAGPASATEPSAGGVAPATAATATAVTATTAAAAAVPNPAPTAKVLLPRGVPSGQQAFTPSAEQLKNVKSIVKAGRDLKLSPRAEVLAVACSLQESKLVNLGNLGNRNDHDSLGLFQQRPSSGWGTPSQVTNADHAAKAFYTALKSVSNFESRPLTDAVQKVQVSAYPDAYAKWEKMASNLVLATYGSGPYAAVGH